MDEGVGRVHDVLTGVFRAGRRRMLEGEVYDLLAAVGVGAPRHGTLPIGAGADEATEVLAALGAERVVLKIHSADILHKTEAGGLAFCEAEPRRVAEEARALVARVREARPDAALDGVLVCRRVPFARDVPGTEALLALRSDPAFGPVVVLGLGGVLTEWYGALGPGRSTWVVSAHDPLFTREDPPDPASLGPGVALLVGRSRLHGEPPFSWPALWGALRRLASLGVALASAHAGAPVLEELEINPLVSVDGAPVALDGVGRVVAAPGPARPARPIPAIEHLLAPRSVAVLGASARGINSGRIILQNLRSARCVEAGKLWAIHPREASIDGVPCASSVADLPEEVDLAVVSVPAEAARDAIWDIVEGRKARSLILIPGGFAETGERALAQEITATLDASRGRAGGGPVLLGGNCLGVVSKGRYNTFFLPQWKLPWSDARGDELLCISQSGAYLVTLGSNLDGVIAPTAAISYGNQMDLTAADLLEHALGMGEVRIIATYVEGFEPLDGRRFVDLVRQHRAAGRHVLIYKAGRTAAAAAAAASHTASLAGDWEVARALLAQAGAQVAGSLDELEDMIQTFTLLAHRPPAGRRVGVLSNAGFECSSAMDALGALEPARLGAATRARLAACMPVVAHADNPIDATPMATTEQVIAAAEALLADPGVDVVVLSAVPVTPALNVLTADPTVHGEDVSDPRSFPHELVRLFRSTTKPVVVSIDSGAPYDAAVRILRQAGVPTWRRIDRAMGALARYCLAWE